MSQAADTARVFIALWPDADVREQLRAWRDGCAWPKSASPVRTEQLHATLHFLGSIPRDQLPELAAGLDVPFAPFELRFGHAEVWHGGVAVLAPDVVPEPLLALHGALGTALERLGLPLEARPYRPHITLARRAGREPGPIQGPPFRWRIDGYALMESKSGDGSEYSVLRSYAAAGSGV